MDQELKAYLEGLEARMEERNAGLEARMEERFERLEERNVRLEARMDERFERLEERGGESSRQIEALREEVRHTRVLVESVDGNVRLVAEGVMGVTERLESFQEATADHFTEIKAAVTPAYQNLNSRVHSLDDQVQGLDSRVRSVDNRLRILEARADRQTEDVLESIRKKFGKPQA